MSFQLLPIDIQLLIIDKLDIDTRIKANIVRKIKVPPSLLEKLESFNKVYSANYTKRITSESSHVVTLNIGQNKMYECYYHTKDDHAYWYAVSVQDNTFPSNLIYPKRAN